VGLLANAWTAVAFKWETRKRRFHRIAWAEIGGCLGAVSTQLVAGLALASPSGTPLICGALLGRFTTLLIMCRGTCADLLHLRGHVSIGEVKSMARRYWRFPTLGSGALLLFSASAEVPKLMLGTLFLPQILGFYTISMRVVGSPALLVSRAVGNVFLPRIAEIRHDARRSRAFILKTCGKLAVLASVPAILLLLTGERVFAIAFGEPWATAGHYARLLIPLFVARFVISPLGPSLQVFEKQNVVFVWNFFLLGLSVGAFVIGRHVGGAETAILSYSLVTAGMWVIYLGMCLHYAHHLRPRGTRTDKSSTSPRGETRRGQQPAKETIHAPSVLA
jgi:O-antigen/teichoic acid export membrane protein